MFSKEKSRGFKIPLEKICSQTVPTVYPTTIAKTTIKRISQSLISTSLEIGIVDPIY
jgi:hypothetical protein